MVPTTRSHPSTFAWRRAYTLDTPAKREQGRCENGVRRTELSTRALCLCIYSLRGVFIPALGGHCHGLLPIYLLHEFQSNELHT